MMDCKAQIADRSCEPALTLKAHHESHSNRP